MKVESRTVNKPSVQTMAKIAKALGVLIEGILEEIRMVDKILKGQNKNRVKFNKNSSRS